MSEWAWDVCVREGVSEGVCMCMCEGERKIGNLSFKIKVEGGRVGWGWCGLVRRSDYRNFIFYNPKVEVWVCA